MKISKVISTFLFVVVLSSFSYPSTSLSIPPNQDAPGYTFGRYRLPNGRVVTRTCAWLTANPAKKAKRLDRWCDVEKKLHGFTIRVRDMCQISCKREPVTPNICTGTMDYPIRWKDELGDGCDFYERGDNCNIWGNGYAGDLGLTAKGACRQCGGGCTDLGIPDSADEWFDSEGRFCKTYASDPGLCNEFGDRNRNFGLVANEACCACRGGTKCFNFNFV